MGWTRVDPWTQIATLGARRTLQVQDALGVLGTANLEP